MENTCLNCKHWEKIKEYPGDGICTNNNAFRSYSEVITGADNFCKYFESNSIHLASLKIDNTEMYEELDNLKKEFAESGLSMNEFIKLKINEDNIFKNPCQNDSKITQEVKLVNFDDLTDEFKEKYFK